MSLNQPRHSKVPIHSQAPASAFHGAHDFSISGGAQFLNVGEQTNYNITSISSKPRDMSDLLKEFVSFDALYDSFAQDPGRRCHPGTRTNVLKQINNWKDATQSASHIFWLHGPAGVGKSSIAQTISRTHGRGMVAATFFFYRSDPHRNNGNHLFPTLAWQLAKSIPGAEEHIVNALNKDPSIPKKEIEAQFEHLIARPLRKIAKASPDTQALPPTVVIDGVDECLDEKLQRRFLDILGKMDVVDEIDVPLEEISISLDKIDVSLDEIDTFLLNKETSTSDEAMVKAAIKVVIEAATSKKAAMTTAARDNSAVELIQVVTELVVDDRAVVGDKAVMRAVINAAIQAAIDIKTEMRTTINMEARGLATNIKARIEKVIERAVGAVIEAKDATLGYPIRLRFLIASRPEAHIEDIFRRFETLWLDLAKLDDAHHDIEKYLKFEFTRITSEQDIDPNIWPGNHVIQDLVSRSSGQFVYASTVIKFVGDEYNSAISHLNIILGLKALDGKSPFATLDALYLEILQRQPDQQFLTEFLCVFFVFPCHSDDRMLLLNINHKELRRKLRGMHSVLNVGQTIRIYHESFMEFLQEPSRSRQYGTNGSRLYSRLIVATLIRYATGMMTDPSHHDNDHFVPKFSNEVRTYPLWVNLTLRDWEEVLDPLIRVKDRLLEYSGLSSFSAHGLCKECSVIYTIDDLLLHLAFYRTISHIDRLPPQALREQELASMIANKKLHGSRNYADKGFSSLFSLVKESSWALEIRAMVDALHTLQYVDPNKAVSEVQSVSDAQSVVDFTHYVINNKDVLAQYYSKAIRNATQLALGIYTRIPVFPQLFLDPTPLKIDQDGFSYYGHTIYKGSYQDKPVEVWFNPYDRVNPMCQIPFIWGAMSHENISPLLGVCKFVMQSKPAFVLVIAQGNETLHQWRQKVSRPVSAVKERILEVAEAFRYLHSLGLVLVHPIDWDNIILDPSYHARIPGFCHFLGYCRDTPAAYRHLSPVAERLCTYESNVLLFGRIFYQVYFNQNIPILSTYGSNADMDYRPHKPEIEEKTWKLIQRCCAENPKARPTMNQVVEEMKSWKRPRKGGLSLAKWWKRRAN